MVVAARADRAPGLAFGVKFKECVGLVHFDDRYGLAMILNRGNYGQYFLKTLTDAVFQ